MVPDLPPEKKVLRYFKNSAKIACSGNRQMIKPSFPAQSARKEKCLVPGDPWTTDPPRRKGWSWTPLPLVGEHPPPLHIRNQRSRITLGGLDRI